MSLCGVVYYKGDAKTMNVNESRKITANIILNMKKQGRKITALTAYDYSFAKIIDNCGIDIVLVGDTLGMVICGYENTLPVKMDDMVYHTRAVKQGIKNALLVADMPFMSYHVSIEEAIKNAGRLVKEGGAEAVKLEGGVVMMETIEAIIDIGIPVISHIGLTPQYKNMLGGYKVQGKTPSEYQNLIEDANAVEEAGAFAVVLEGIPSEVAKKITKKLIIPTIGIGAGQFCDGQIMVSYDILGLSGDFSPKFVKKYAKGEKIFSDAIRVFADEVRNVKFPTDGHSYHLDKRHLYPVQKD